MTDGVGYADLPVLAELGDRLEIAFAAAEQAARVRSAPRARRRWVGLRPAVVALLLFVLLAAGTAAAALLALRGSVIPAPQKEDLQPPMIVQPATAHLSGVTARDPVDLTVWTVRLSRSETGLECVTAGELRDGQFGINGLDGRFRTLAPGFADGCGAPGKGQAAIVGARVFDSDKHADVRTVVDGYGGRGLRSAVIETTTGTHRAPVSPEGAFVAAFAGYPEDIGIRVTLRFADGHVEVHRFGTSSFIAPDPGGALRIETFQISGHERTLCVYLTAARQQAPYTRSPTACGDTRSDYFFMARRMHNGEVHGSGRFGWEWHHPARTILFGHAHRVKQLVVLGAGRPRRLATTVNGGFQLVLPGSVDPVKLTLVVTKRGGSVERRRGSWALTAYPGRRGCDPRTVCNRPPMSALHPPSGSGG